MKRILLTGASGQVGYELNRSLSTIADVYATTTNQLDLSKLDEIGIFVRDLKPDLIVNAAAYTAVDKAESDRELAQAINADAVGVLASLAAEMQLPLIHYSTDYVFNGYKTVPWIETDGTSPLGVYGKTKLDGEKAIIASGCDYLIFRTSWVYSARGQNFLLTMLKLARERDEVSVVSDQIGTPTWSRHLADATALVISKSLKQADFWSVYKGVYHVSGGGETSWYGFAKAIFEEMNQRNEKVPKLIAISTADYPTAAQRPHYSCLDNSKLEQNFAIKLPNWHDSLRLMMTELA